MRYRVMFLFVLSTTTAQAETFKVWTGELQVPTRPCGDGARVALRLIVSKAPLLVLKNGAVTIYTENHADKHISKRCDRTLESAADAAGAVWHWSFWDEKEVAGTFIVKIMTSSTAKRRPIELITIRRRDTSEPCFERWVGIAEVQ